jgi:hypothetical protein
MQIETPACPTTLLGLLTCSRPLLPWCPAARCVRCVRNPTSSQVKVAWSLQSLEAVTQLHHSSHFTEQSGCHQTEAMHPWMHPPAGRSLDASSRVQALGRRVRCRITNCIVCCRCTASSCKEQQSASQVRARACVTSDTSGKIQPLDEAHPSLGGPAPLVNTLITGAQPARV